MDSSPLHTRVDKQALRSFIRNWRDHHVGEVFFHLDHQLPVLFNAIDKELDAASIKDLVVSSKKFSLTHIQPIYNEWIEREAGQLLEAAQADLNKICAHSLNYDAEKESLEHMEDTHARMDVAATVVSASSGVAVIPFFTSAAVVSAGGIGGILGLTTISWPIVVVGVVVSALLLGTSGSKFTTLRTKALGKYKDALHKFIRQQLFGGDKPDDSVSGRIEDQITKVANAKLQELDT